MALFPFQVLGQLTTEEIDFVQNLVGLSYAQGDILYYDGVNLTRLPAGTNGWFLKTQGAGANPTWVAVPGGGDVLKVGTPVNNQVGVWTGDGTIEGDAGLTFDTTTDLLTTGIVNATSLTASEIVITDGSKNLVSAAVATYPSLTELTYVKGVTSAIQTQINAKAPTTAPTFATSITGSYLTASEILITDGSKNIVSAAVATYPSLTELTYVKGVTSAIQTQLGGKQATISFGTGVQTALGVNIGSAGAPVLFDGALGTPTSGTVTNLTGTASININGTVGATTPTTGVFTTLVAGSTTSLLLGTAGSAVGNIGFRNATSGTITLAPATGALGTVTLTLPIATDTLVGKSTSDILTNKVMNLPFEINDTSDDHQYVFAVSELTADRTVTLPLLTGDDEFVFKAHTQTLTNKRVTKRTGTTTSHATPTINTDNVDFYSITAQTEAITSMTTNLSGTPTEGQTLWIAITGTAARAITWGASFEASTVALPTTTVTTNRLDVGFVWNTVTSKWRCIASA